MNILFIIRYATESRLKIINKHHGVKNSQFCVTNRH